MSWIYDRTSPLVYADDYADFDLDDYESDSRYSYDRWHYGMAD